MTLRKWIGILAVLGVLAHAAALVRHNASVVGMAVAAATTADVAASGAIGGELATDLQVICSAAYDGITAAVDHSSSAPGGTKHDCPVCLGLASAYALPAAFIDVVAPRLPAFVVEIAGHDQRVTVHRRIRPPGRGPPHFA